MDEKMTMMAGEVGVLSSPSVSGGTDGECSHRFNR